MKIMKRSRAESGLTLAEVLVAIAVATVILGIAVPSFFALLPGFRLSGAARQVATDLQLARMRAISQNTANTVTFNTATGAYSFSLGPEARDIDSLYPGIAFAAVSANPTFTARGTTTAAVTITISNGTNQRLVCVNAIGRVNVVNAPPC